MSSFTVTSDQRLVLGGTSASFLKIARCVISLKEFPETKLFVRHLNPVNN